MEERIALFFDIDGTLFDSETKSVLPSTIKMLNELRKHDNYDLYLSTGRSHQTLGKIQEYIQYFKGLNLSNGQEIYLDNKLIYENYIQKDDLVSLLTISEKMKYPLGLITKNVVEMNFFNEESYDNFTNYIKIPVKDLNHEPFDIKKEVMQIWMFANNQEIDKTSKKFPNLSFLKWGNYGADIIPKDASKGHGIKIIQEIMKYKKGNMYAFGDGDNDVLMFKVVGHSVAMGNSSILAKEAADIVTDPVNNDGLYKAIKKLNLI